MPNWCNNMLRVTARDDSASQQLAEFMAKAKGADTDLSLGNYIPMPPELVAQRSPCRDPDRAADNTARYGAPDWKTWCVNNWGTKWDVEARLMFQDSWIAEYEFTSAWTPPTSWLESVSLQFPDLDFALRFHEDNVAFMGFALARNGVMQNRVLNYSDLFFHAADSSQVAYKQES